MLDIKLGYPTKDMKFVHLSKVRQHTNHNKLVYNDLHIMRRIFFFFSSVGDEDE